MTRPRAVIAGGGPVGLALACACDDFDVVLIESAPARSSPWPAEFDSRVYALSPGTHDFLQGIGAWRELDASRIAIVRRMEVQGDAASQLSFSARPASALAWIVEAGRLAAAIEAVAAARPDVVLRHGVSAVGFHASAEGSSVDLDGGERIAGDLLVGADGPDSQVREKLGLRYDQAPYGEAAIVANFETEREHGGVARQWFRGDGVLAWLPLPGRRISIVWSAPAAHADELSTLEERAFERRVRDAGGAVLGDLKMISAIARFALRSIRVPEPVAAGVALVGDAAHAVHPLAGQGVNLGFQDAQVLARVLAQRSALERPGDMRVLRRYARGRAEDIAAMQFVTNGLDRLFRAPGKPIRALRNAGLALVEMQPLIKSALARRAMR